MKKFESVSTTPVEEFELPEMRNYKEDINELSEEDGGFEALRSDEQEYVSSEEASPEALKRIKAFQSRGKRLNGILGRLGRVA